MLVQCADFKDVFNSGSARNSRSSRKQKTTKTKDPNAREPIKTKEGIYYFVGSGDTLSEIADEYRIEPFALAQINNLFEDSTLSIGRRLFIPHKKKLALYVDEQELKEARKNQKTKKVKKGDFIWPMNIGYISSKFGMRGGRPHNGIDIAARTGTPIYAIDEGVVLHAKWFSSYGKLVVLRHNNGYYSAYAHNDKILVKKGQKVKQGHKISLVGQTGRATGPHLHFEIHKKGGVPVDPLNHLPKNPPF